MKVLMINKFLHPNGGSETYIFKLGEELERQGHEVQFFGMDHPERCVGNRVEAYTANMDFHGGSRLKKLLYPVKTIYSLEARKKLRLVLDDFQPDVCHLNNFNYQLTPSIILEIKKWSRQTGQPCRIVYTAHDYQLVCPNHMMRQPSTNANCEKCLGGHFVHCLKGKCIHGSTAKSAIGCAEAMLWNASGVYEHVDAIICCSRFMKQKLDSNPLFASKTIAVHNFIEHSEKREAAAKPYVLYFGRFSVEKGMGTLLQACKQLPEVRFVFAGKGPMEEQVRQLSNAECVGFKTGAELEQLVREAALTVYPSEWYENCPFSVMESQEKGVPVVGSRIGGIPELIEDGKTGRLFESGNAQQLAEIIRELWNQPELLETYRQHCMQLERDDVSAYVQKLIPIYQGNEERISHE